MAATDPVPLVTWPVFDGLPLRAVVTTRAGGVSTGPYESLDLGLHVGDDEAAVVENRRRVAATLGLGLEDLVVATQVHGAGVVVLDDGDRGRGSRSVADAVGPADAMVTATPGLGLVILVADCVPVVLYAADVHAVACVHAGWRGTVAGVVPAAIRALADLGAEPSGLRAGIGPAIPPADYQVGPEVADAVRGSFGDRAGALLRPDGDRFRLDLLGAVHRQLLDAGLLEAGIATSTSATGPGTPFFSDRAARPCGRVAAVAVLDPVGPR
jgi:YfiH family protein